jgi:hypothetical protein
VQELDNPTLHISGTNARQPQTQKTKIFHQQKVGGEQKLCNSLARAGDVENCCITQKFPWSGGDAVTIRVLHHMYVRTSIRPAAALGSDCAGIHPSRNHISKGAVLRPPSPYLFSFPQIIIWMVKLRRRWTGHVARAME